MKYLIALTLLLIPLAAIAAEIAPTSPYPTVRGGKCIEWLDIGTGDTTASGVWLGGKGTVEVNGELGVAELELYYSRTAGSEISVDSDTAPDGLKFTSSSGLAIANIDLAAGSMTVNFSSAGNNAQSLDISICSIPTNP